MGCTGCSSQRERSIKVISFFTKQKSPQAGMHNVLLNADILYTNAKMPAALSTFHRPQTDCPLHSDEPRQK
jgi:hypothetical protein